MAAPSRTGRSRPTGVLGSLADIRKQQTLLLSGVEAYLLAKHQLPTDRRQDIIHPSEMAKTDWCPRQTYYRLAGTTPTNSGTKFSFQRERIFEEGHDIHAKWQGWLGEMGRLWGRWACTYCGGTEYLGNPSLEAAEDCRDCASPLVYREVPLEAERKYLIAGHADGAIEDLHALLEIKSVGLGTVRMEEPGLVAKHTVETSDGRKIVDFDGLWKALRRPFPSHLRQINIYLALCQEMGLPFDRAVFIYEYKPTQDVKEFVVRYSETIAAPLLDAALDVKYHLKKGQPPQRPAHTGRDTKVCRECPFLQICWEIDEDRETQPVTAGQRESEQSGFGASDPAGRRNPAVTTGPDRSGRQRSDGAIHADDAVGGVRVDEAGGGGDKRKVRRVRIRETQGDKRGGSQGGKDGDSGQS